MSINGQREDANGFMVNGASVEEARNNGASTIPNLDSIGEFRVITNNVDAEYGHFAGGIISVVTKSGTNEFHGDAFEFLRNTDLDAKNFYDVKRGVFRRNQFGGTFGGPVIRDKLFFFVDYQGTRELRGLSSGLVPLPSTAQRSGDFSADPSLLSGNVNGPYFASVLSQRLGYSVNAGEPYYTPGCSPCVFPNGVIPQNVFSPAAKGLLPFIPVPNQGSNLVTSSNNQDSTDNRGGIRIDGNTRFGAFSLYYFIDDSTLQKAFGTNNVPGFPTAVTAHPQQINVSDTKTFGPTAVNEFRFNLTRYVGGADLPTAGVGTKLSALGFQEGGAGGIVPAAPTLEGVPSIGFNNFSIGLPGVVYQRYETPPEVIDNFSKVTGDHTLKMGGMFQYLRFHQRFPIVGGNGFISFTGSETGSDFADFLLGAPSSFVQESTLDYDNRKKYAGFYGQDSWRVKSNLTVNYGVRWDIIPNWIEGRNQTSDTFIAGEQSTVFPTAPKGLVFAGDARPGSGKIPQTVSRTPLGNFAPRIGIAYSPSADSGLLAKILGSSGKTSIRAAYGIFYTNNEGSQVYSITGAPPFAEFYVSPVPSLLERPYVNRSDGAIHPAPFPFTPAQPGSSNFDFSPFLPLSGFPVWSIHNRTPYAEDYHLTVQRQFGSATVLSVGYVGSQSHALMTGVDANPGNPALCLGLSNPAQVAPGTATCGPFGENGVYTRADGTVVNGTRSPLGANFGDNLYFQSIGNSNYNSLQTSLRYSSERLSFLAAYTYSKSIDNASGARTSIVNPLNYRLSRSLSAFDVPHSFVVSYDYRLPIDIWAGNRYRRLTAGWQLAGITRFTSGLPITLSESDDRSLLGITTQPLDTPNYLGGVLSFERNPRTQQPYFDVTKFTQETLGHTGTASNRFFHGPGLNNFDLSLIKDTNITERISAEFRAEFFNVFNHAQFYNPSGNINGNFGIVTSARDPRIGQLAVKILF